MDTCGQFQEQLLDYLYDVLEGDEAQAVRGHLAACTACQEALRRAEGQQQLLAAAARAEFPSVRFDAPAETLPFRAPAKAGRAPTRRRWLGIAAAAAVLLAVAGAGIPAGITYRNYAATQQAVTHYQQQIAEASRAEQDAQARMAKATADRNEHEAALRKSAEERQLKVVVSGPPTVQPGAPSQYDIQTRNLADQNVPARLTMRVRDAEQKVVYEEKDVATAGDYRLALPASLPLKPNSRLALEVVARRDGGPAEELHEELSLATPLYVAHLTTDKPIYRPGETVYYRALALDRFSFKPPDEDLTLHFELRKPDGSKADLGTGISEVVRKAGEAPLTWSDGKPLRGLASGAWAIDAGAPGGEYTLLVSEAGNRFPPQERKFLVNRYERQALNKELEWSRKSYGPGEDVLANCKVSLAEGGKPVANRPVIAAIHIDGRFYGADGKPATAPLSLHTDAEGKVAVHFKLPPAEAMSRGLGTLSVNFTDGANNESINKPIPITLNKLDVDFYPEGGDLVAGVPNRVYFQVHNMLGKPADLRGKVVDNTGKVACDGVETLTVPDQPGANQGMGRFAFTPEPGKTYGLKIESPAGIQGDHPLPAIAADKVALSVPTGVTNPGEPIRVTVHSPTEDRSLLVGAYCRGRLMDHQRVTVKKGEAATVELRPAQEVGGVYRVTAFEEQPGAGNREQLRPLAERLVYRMPERRLNLAVQPDRKQYIPGDRPTLTLRATDEKGQPVPAVVLVAVVDKSVLTMADEKTARSMPTHFYLTSEVRKPEELEHADFLLTDHPKAKEALDLLLGTQGWRRFAEQDPAKFRNAHPEEADRLLVSIGQNSTKTTDFLKEDVEKIEKEYRTSVVQLNHERDQAAADLQGLQHSADYAQAQARLAEFQRSFEKMRTQTLPVAAAVVLLALFVALAVLILRASARSVPLYVGAAVCAVLLVVVLVSQVGTKNGAADVQEHMAFDKAQARRPEVAMAPVGAMNAPPVAPPMPLEAPMQEDRAEGMPPPPAPAGAMPGRGAGGAPAPGMPPPNVPAAPRAMFMKPMAMKGGAKADKRPNDLGMNGDLGKQAAQFGNFARLADERAKKAEAMGKRLDGAVKDQMRQQEKEQADLRELQLLPQGLRRVPFAPAGGIAAARPAPPPPPFVVREYAHVRQPGATPDQRSDFTETLCWEPVLLLPDGKGEVSFGLSDSVTTFEVAAMGHTPDGRIGSVTATLASRLPFALAPKVPIEVTSSDRIDIPVSVSNSTTEPRDVNLHVKALGLALRDGGSDKLQLTVPAEGRVRRLFAFQPSLVEGEASLEVTGEAKQLGGDSIRRTFAVVPEGFPILAAHSDVLEKVLEQNVVLPNTWVQGTLQLRADVYPSTLADLQKGLEALLREPGGCFEQTSTSNYPNLLILDYLKETDQTKPEVQQRALAMLDHGYHILTGYECPYDNQGRHGYEWFGSPNRGHEALTAYGLMEFRDMARVYKVDPAMLERTRKFLMDQRDGQGGFKRNPLALDTFGRAPQDVTNAYIVWALTESGKDDVTRELNALAEQAKGSKDPYFLALVANSLLNRDRAAEAVALLKKIADLQKPDGHVDAERTSITGSGGRDLQIETTALAVLGWLKANRPAEFTTPLQKAIRWVGGQRGGYGGFGSTQSTILALKALIGYAKANKKTAQAGEVRLYVNDVRVAQKSFEAGTQDALTLTLPEAEKHLHAGKNRVRVEITGDKNVFPCTVSWSYHTLQPPSAEGAPVHLSTKLDRDHADEGETLHLTVTLENTQPKGQGMAVAVVGLPAGLSLPEDLKQLKQHAELRNHGTERGLISYFETRGRELVLYWRDLAPDQKIEVPVDLICRVPGQYRGPASRAYLYYNSDTKFWTEPLQVAIQAKE